MKVILKRTFQGKNDDVLTSIYKREYKYVVIEVIAATENRLARVHQYLAKNLKQAKQMQDLKFSSTCICITDAEATEEFERLLKLGWLPTEELYNSLFVTYDTSRGVVRGRPNKYLILAPTEKIPQCKVYDRKVVLTGGYDKGGVYWGTGNELRVQFSEDGRQVTWYWKR